MPCSCRRTTASAVQRCAVRRPQRKSSTRVAAAAAASKQVPASHATDKSQEILAQLAKGQGVNRYAAETKPCIISIGLTCHSTPVTIREKLSMQPPEWPRAIEELVAFPHIEEAGVISTCNRFEIYVVALSWHRGVREVEEWMSRASGVPLEELRPHLFLMRNRDATWHLLRVSAGLDSLIMGEGQILSQIKKVYTVGQECHGFGRHLNGLFKQALTAGKRVRCETSISTGSVSVSSAAVELAQLKLPTQKYEGVRVTIIGAGTMSELLVKHLISKGCKSCTVLNRSLPRSEALIELFPDMEFDIKLMPELMETCSNSDVIFAASGSEDILVTAEDVKAFAPAPELVGQRRFIDISVPRNLATEISDVEGNIVYNVDDLAEVVSANKDARMAAAKEAEVLLHEEQMAFEAWRDSLETVPTIKALRQKAEDVRSVEVEKAMKKLGEGMSKKQLRAVEDLSKGIVNKLLHGPMTALRCDGSDPEAVNETLTNMEALERMFELQTDARLPSTGKR